MKLYLTILLVFSNLILFAQLEHAKLYLKDGSVLKGYAKIKIDNTIKFKENRNSKPEFFDFRKVKKAEINCEEYVYKMRNDKKVKRPILLKIECLGRVNLYSLSYMTSVMYGMNTSLQCTEEWLYFVSRDDGVFVDYACATGGLKNKRFRKFATLYFNDCPSLCKKINAKKYTRRDMASVVIEYNKKMSSLSKK